MNHIRFGNRNGSKRAIINRLGLGYIEFRDQSRLVSGFRDGHHRLLRGHITTEHIRLLLHLAEVEVSRSHLCTKANHGRIVFLFASRIKFFLRFCLLTNHPEHIELPTHLHGSTVIARPSLRCSSSQVSTSLLTFPATMEGQRRIKVTLRDSPLGFCLVNAIDSHEHRRILVHSEVDQGVECGILEYFPPPVIHRQDLLEKRILLLPPVGQRTIQIVPYLLGIQGICTQEKA